MRCVYAERVLGPRCESESAHRWERVLFEVRKGVDGRFHESLRCQRCGAERAGDRVRVHGEDRPRIDRQQQARVRPLLTAVRERRWEYLSLAAMAPECEPDGTE